MGVNLRPFIAALEAEKAKLNRQLASGRARVKDIAIVRRACDNMQKELKKDPSLFKSRDPARWGDSHEAMALYELFPHEATDENAQRYIKRYEEYVDLAMKIAASPDMSYQYAEDRYRRRVYLYRPNPLVPKIMVIVGQELLSWFRERQVDYSLLFRPASIAFETLFLVERPDIRVLLRIAQTLPLDVEISDLPIDRPAIVEALELAISLVPVVGNIVAAYEAFSGVDLFGYQLTDLERGILGASILLPLAGRVVKGGRAIYTEARMVALYGQDAAAWSKAVRAGAQASTSRQALQVIGDAEALIRAQTHLDRSLAQKVVNSLPHVVRQNTAVSSTVDQAVGDLFRRLASKHGILGTLDELAMQRILSKGPNVDHIKGQLLEELLESQLVPWLRDRAGSFALGIETGGKKLEFIPGHLIRDTAGRQITDGVLAFRNNGVLEIVAIFEAKAGKRAARELSMASGSISSLSKADRAELRAYARDVLEEQREIAREAGIAFKKTLEEVEQEVALSEYGGQVRRDIERLFANPDGPLTNIRVSSESIPVRISPTRTKFFGVLPKDVNRSLIERELRDSGYSFEILGVNIGQRDLKSVADEILTLITQGQTP